MPHYHRYRLLEVGEGSWGFTFLKNYNSLPTGEVLAIQTPHILTNIQIAKSRVSGISIRDLFFSYQCKWALY